MCRQGNHLAIQATHSNKSPRAKKAERDSFFKLNPKNNSEILQQEVKIPSESKALHGRYSRVKKGDLRKPQHSRKQEVGYFTWKCDVSGPRQLLHKNANRQTKHTSTRSLNQRFHPSLPQQVDQLAVSVHEYKSFRRSSDGGQARYRKCRCAPQPPLNKRTRMSSQAGSAIRWFQKICTPQKEVAPSEDLSVESLTEGN